MAYIGKSPANVKKDLTEKDLFTGDGSTVAFDLTNVALDANSLQVFVDNVRQEPGAGKSYTLGNDGSGDLKRITFTVAPEDNAVIYALNPGVKDSVLNTVSDSAITEAKLGTGSVTSAKIADGTIANADVSPSAAIADSKLATITTASKVNVSSLSAPGSTSLFLRGDRSYAAIPTEQIDTNAFNISLLGFKMAVNEGLTVFNLVDGIVDEFHDESGTDEAEGSNDLYCASNDNYVNRTATVSISAGFTTTTITEPQTSTAGTNPTEGAGTLGAFTVPASGLTSVAMKVWGAGGSSSWDVPGYGDYNNTGGAGGFSSGTLAVTAGQVLRISAGEGGYGVVNPESNPQGGPAVELFGAGPGASGGAGIAGVFTTNSITPGCHSAPGVYMVAGGGGGSGGFQSNIDGGVGGGTTAGAGNEHGTNAQTDNNGPGECSGGGGDQEQGGQSLATGPSLSAPQVTNGSFLQGGSGSYGGAGGGFYGGGAGGRNGHQSPGDKVGAGGGGSSYVGHPQITSGSTEAGEACMSSGGEADPDYAPIPYEAGEGGNSSGDSTRGQDGFVLITGTQCGSTTSTTIVSNAFTSTSVPTTSRIVVFQENIDTPTINTDVIASISRDGGSNFTTATLTDSGYVTGSSGQRILTGQATISGQPSGQSMRWKLALANNAVKIHGVSLQWA